MKTRFIFIALLSFCSCDKFLEIDSPKSKVSSEVVFSNPATASSAITGIYHDMLNQTNFASGSDQSIVALCGLSADELTNRPRQNISITAFDENNLTADNVYVYELWQSLYKIVYQANSAIEGLRASTTLPGQIKDQLIGEALFVRAFTNFYLVNLFGDIPLLTTTDYVANAQTGRIPVSKIYEQIVEDLTAAQTMLAVHYVRYPSNGPAERIRPNKFAATALLARVHLFLENWPLAEQQASLVIEDPMYDLVSDLDAVFLKNSAETIWQLGSVYTDFNTLEGFYFSATNASQYNVMNEAFLNAFEENDARKNNWLTSIVHNGDTIYLPYKYKQGANQATSVTEYSMVLRLAEQYLIRAEARARQNKLTGPNSSEADINIIRARAGLTATTASTQGELTMAIEKERQAELFTEWGHRWFDLKRWKRASDVLGPIKSSWNAGDVLYPLPQLEMNNNPNLKPQNSEY
jgi:hypothetical protein